VSAFANHVRLEASGTGKTPKGAPVGAVPADERIEVTVVLRAGGEHEPGVRSTLLGTAAPGDRPHLELAELEDQRQASAMDVARVEAFAAHYGLTVTDSRPEQRTVALAGTAEQLGAAFRVDMACYETEGGTYRVRTSPVHVPEELKDIVVAVVGFDNRPQVVAHFRRLSAEAAADPRPFTPIEVGALYAFPAGSTGQGQTVAIVEFGGGIDEADFDAYLDSLGLSTHPQLVVRSIDGAPTAAGVDTDADGEVQLDADVIGALAPEATIVMYFAPNTSRGFIDAISAAVHDPDHRPCAISISWGMAEEHWSEQTRSALDEAFQDAGMLGITVCAAAGDDGSVDNVTDGSPHVDYPAASPWVLGCGGTRLTATADGSIDAEVVWDDRSQGGGATGGGISTLYPQPDWQQAAKPGAAGRGVPDVAGDASPTTGYRVRIDGREHTIGGTSAVAPLWSALVARMTEGLGTSIGFLNPLVYQEPASATFRDIVSGSNGSYEAASGWDPCTGMGTPDGTALLAALAPSPVKR
jgi:kumamolisin